MLSLKVFVALAFLCLQVCGKDLDNYNKISECVRKAAAENYGNLKYSPYNYPDPFSASDKTFKITYTNIVIKNALTYTLTPELKSKDGAKIVEIKYSAIWPTIAITADADGQYKGNFYKGPADITITNVKWEGTVKYERPECGKCGGKIISLDLSWTNEDVKIIFKLPQQPFTSKVSTDWYNNYVKENKEYTEDRITKKLTDFWLSKPDELKKLFDFCQIKL